MYDIKKSSYDRYLGKVKTGLLAERIEIDESIKREKLISWAATRNESLSNEILEAAILPENQMAIACYVWMQNYFALVGDYKF